MERKAAGLSQKELAAKADIPNIRMSRIERGEAEPRYSDFSSIAKVLEVPAPWLMPDPKENPLDREIIERLDRLGVEAAFFREGEGMKTRTIDQKVQLRDMLGEIEESVSQKD